MKQYDTTFIINGTLDQQQRENLIARLEKILQKQGAEGVPVEINRVVRWGMRDLSYPINKQVRAYYVIFYYNADPSVVKPFENQLRLNEHVLRYMTMVSTGKHPDYIRDEGKQVAVVTEIEESVLSEGVPSEPVEISEPEAEELPLAVDEGNNVSDEFIESGELDEDFETTGDIVDDDSIVNVNNAEIDGDAATNGDKEKKENDRAED